MKIYHAMNVSAVYRETTSNALRGVWTRTFSGFGVAVLLTGCIFSTPAPRPVSGPRPDPLPLQIGVHFPPELRDFNYRHHATDTAYVLGEPSVQLLKDEFSLRFAKVVDSPLPGAGSDLPAGLAGVAEVRITSAGFEFTVWHTHVTYELTLFAPDGKRIASWQATGWGRRPVTNPLTVVNAITENFAIAMAEAAHELASGFRGVPESQRLLNEQGGS